MTAEGWLGLAALALVPMGGLMAWIFTVARDLGMIVSNTESLARRIDSVDADNTYIRGKVDEHADKLGELTERTHHLESSVEHMKKRLA